MTKVIVLASILFLLSGGLVLYPVYGLHFEEIVAVFPLMVSFSMTFGIAMLTIATKKLRRVLRNLRDTQSSSTFLYARKRQA